MGLTRRKGEYRLTQAENKQTPYLLVFQMLYAAASIVVSGDL